MGTGQERPAYADVELSLPPDPLWRPLVRSVAVEACQADEPYATDVRMVTDTIVCALLALASRHTRQLRCLFRTLDGEVRVQVCLLGTPMTAPQAKARSARLLSRLDMAVNAFTAGNETHGTELVYEVLVSRR
jgi:hypothetical protein